MISDNVPDPVSIDENETLTVWGSKLLLDGSDQPVRIFKDSLIRGVFDQQFFNCLADAFASIEKSDARISFVIIECFDNGNMAASAWPRMSELWAYDVLVSEGRGDRNFVVRCDVCSRYTCGHLMEHHAEDCKHRIVWEVLNS